MNFRLFLIEQQPFSPQNPSHNLIVNMNHIGSYLSTTIVPGLLAPEASLVYARLRLTGAAKPSPPDAVPAWGLRGGKGFTKVRSTEADHVGPASGRNATF